jgi:hypothetical protein
MLRENSSVKHSAWRSQASKNSTDSGATLFGHPGTHSVSVDVRTRRPRDTPHTCVAFLLLNIAAAEIHNAYEQEQPDQPHVHDHVT